MTDYGLVSIITPSYNTARFIGETIRSVQAQTYPNWEMMKKYKNKSLKQKVAGQEVNIC